MLKIIKRLFFAFLILGGITLIIIYYCDYRVRSVAQNKTFSDVNNVPHSHAGLLLGTARYLRNGAINPYYSYRIAAARELLNAKKIDYLIISGDNGRAEYNEPEMMRNDLVAGGIDSTRIYLDYAGFRTFDSVIRLREIFSQDTVTFISQKFHNERALYIAKREGIAASGFNARDVPAGIGLKVQLREKLARVKIFADYLFNASPKFLGPKIQIPE